MKVENLILGAGIAGLGAAYGFYQKGKSSCVVEKNSTYGGLCDSFEINGFRFDRFVHLTFAQEKEVNDIFRKSCGELTTHIPNPFNLYHGLWVKHPAQNNLYPLDEEEKKLIVSDFMKRPTITKEQKPDNYEEWLRWQFGNYFAEHFPMVYTRKYWMKEASQLRTEWVGKRIYQPSVDEVIAGCNTAETPVTYYAKEMRYPKKGGFKALLREMAVHADIKYNYEVKHIDTQKKEVTFGNGEVFSFENLYSSIPLPEIIAMLDDVPSHVSEAASKLEATSGYHISIALKTKDIPPYLWWYIYDADILAARVYSPSLKSADNAPEGCSSLQMEVYCKEGSYTEQQLLDGTVGRLIELGIINKDDILFTHVGFEKYANVIFTEPIYDARKTVRDYLATKGICTFGRFGEWDYLWTNQSLLSGLTLSE